MNTMNWMIKHFTIYVQCDSILVSRVGPIKFRQEYTGSLKNYEN